MAVLMASRRRKLISWKRTRPLIKDARDLNDLPAELHKQAEDALLLDDFVHRRYKGEAGPLLDRSGTPRLIGYMEGDLFSRDNLPDQPRPPGWHVAGGHCSFGRDA